MQAVIGLGANLGDPVQAVRRALADLAGLPRTRVVVASSLYRTTPVEASGPDFVNAVAVVETGLPAPDLLRALQTLEQGAGRERPFRHAPRTLDLDLLLYGEARIDSPRLQVPHPRLRDRAFVLVPMAEVAPEQVTATELARVADQPVFRIE